MMGIRSCTAGTLAAILGAWLAGCATPQAAPPLEGPTVEAPRASDTPGVRWLPTNWADLPGWADDRVADLWPALLRSCDRIGTAPASNPDALAWQRACPEARALAVTGTNGRPDEAGARTWLQTYWQAYALQAPDGRTEGLLTGYYEPSFDASRRPRPGFNVPLYAPPADLLTRKPWYNRAQIASDPAARAALRGRELAWVADPLDALVLQIQGSGRLMVTEPDGRRRLVRMAFAGHNDQPYRSVGRWLVERGSLTLDQVNWPAIRAWSRANPALLNEMLDANPRYVFFREEPLADPALGPNGAQGLPLTPGRSIAVDKSVIALGSLVWLDSTEPAPGAAAAAARPLRRLVLAQDTGGAIVGPVRADYFTGWDSTAEALAGRMKQPLRLWVLRPR